MGEVEAHLVGAKKFSSTDASHVISIINFLHAYHAVGRVSGPAEIASTPAQPSAQHESLTTQILAANGEG